MLAGHVATFYCARLRLIVEVDSERHMMQETAARQTRDHTLSARGVSVIRISNKLVITDLNGTLRFIWEACSVIASHRFDLN